MIVNLNKINKYNKISTKVCIVGAGTAGLFLASQLNLKKNELVILEAGDEHAISLVGKYFKVNSKSHYNNKNEPSRMFGIGGTSTIWGGSMVPMQTWDFENKNSSFSWPIKFAEIQKYYSIVKKKLNIEIFDVKKNINNTYLKKKNYNLKFCKKVFHINYSSYLTEGKKNFFNAFIKEIKNSNLIYSNARVFKINNLAKKKNNKFLVKNILAISDNGNILDIQADIFVLCCGAVESTRLIYTYNNDNKNFLLKNKISLGNNFSEQFRITCGTFNIKNWKKFRELFSPIYWQNRYHFPRLQLKSNLKKNMANLNISCQFLYERSNKDWIMFFKFIRKKKFNFRYIVSIFKQIPKIIYDLYNFFYLRKIRKIFWFQEASKIKLFVNFDQKQYFNNKLIVKKSIYRGHKVNKTLLLWKVRRDDIKTVKIFCKIFKEFWQKAELKKIAYFRSIPQNLRFISKSLKVYYHPTGSLMIGKKNSRCVTNENLRLKYVDNIYICSTAVFPYGASANTGLTLLALASRLSDHIKKKLIY
jgi:hypothetical protein